MIQPAYRIGGEAEALVGVIEREVDERVAAGRQEVPGERRLARLAGAREHRDRPGGQPAAKQIDQAARVQGHAQEKFQCHCKISRRICT